MQVLTNIVGILKAFGGHRLGILCSRPDLIQKVVDFVDELLEEENRLLPDLAVSGSTYRPRSLLVGSESSISGYDVVDRAKEMGAKDGEDDARFLMENQVNIPESWREYTFLFPSWMAPQDPHEQRKFMTLQWVEEDLCWKPRPYALTRMFDCTDLVLC